MRAIMYHYVREYNPSLPEFKFLDLADFNKQLNWFEDNFGFVTKNEFEHFILTKELPQTPGKVILTFDDGFSDHFDHVYPELIKRDLWGLFYVPMGPYITNKILDVHRIQILCGKIPSTQLLQQTLSLVSEDMMDDSQIQKFRNERYNHQVNTEEIKQIKLILNYFIQSHFKETIIDTLCNQFDIDDRAENHYISKEQITIMNNNKMMFGGHTVNHKVMSILDRTSQEYEITESFSLLDSFIQQELKTYCHPYGRPSSYNYDTLNILQNQGVDFSFNIESRQIDYNDMIDNAQLLPRYDCNEFPHGHSR